MAERDGFLATAAAQHRTRAEHRTSRVKNPSPEKFAAILLAARNLFLQDGFDRTSVDAIASEADVSKRTVYDYFGDKQSLLLRLIDDMATRLTAAVASAISLIDGPDIERGLIAYATTLDREALGTPDHLALVRLMATEQRQVPELMDHWVNNAAEGLLADRLESLRSDGLLAFDNAKVAASHLVALTLAFAGNYSFAFVRNPEDLDRSEQIAASVRVFLNTYRA